MQQRAAFLTVRFVLAQHSVLHGLQTYLKISVVPAGNNRSTSDVGVRTSFARLPGIPYTSVQFVNPASFRPSTSV